MPNARKKRERFWCRNVTKGVRGALKRSQGSQIETFVTKRSKDPLEILFSARNLLPVNEKTALQGGLIEG